MDKILEIKTVVTTLFISAVIWLFSFTNRTLKKVDGIEELKRDVKDSKKDFNEYKEQQKEVHAEIKEVHNEIKNKLDDIHKKVYNS